MKGSVKFYEGRGWVVQYYDPKGKKRIFKTFRQEDDAKIFQASLNVRMKEGSLDARDYAKDNPLGFGYQAEHWLDYRDGTLRDLRHLRSHILRACDFFGNRNIKEIGYADLEDFLHSLSEDLSSKTKKNIFTTLHSFLGWVAKRERDRGFTIPEFPVLKFTLGWRNTVDKETQQAIIEEVKRISYHINPKIWIGIKWLATYVAIRPGELIQIREGDFDLSLGVVNVKHNKENKPKTVPLLDEDIGLIRSFPRGLPHVFFFRHERRRGLNEAKRARFGKDYLYTWWRRACGNLAIEGVDLYGGTRHSTVRALREYLTPDQIKRGTMHHTNAAFERYFQIELEDARQVYRAASLHTSCINEKGKGGGVKVLKLRS